MRNIVAGLLCMIVVVVSAQENMVPMKDVEGFRQNLSEKTSEITSIQADFTQEKFMSILSQQLVSNGQIKYKAPNMVRWSYKEPYMYDIILNGKEIIINDEGNVNAFSVGSSKMFSEMNQLIVNSVQGNVLDDSKFKIAYFETANYNMARLVPLDKNQLGTFLKEIEVYFDKQNYSVARLKMVEPEGDHTEIAFENKAFNQNISDAIFTQR